MKSKRRLIEDWLPIAALSAEASASADSMTACAAANDYLHVWFARRPLVASRAAILGSLLAAMRTGRSSCTTLGIHGDPVGSESPDRCSATRRETVLTGSATDIRAPSRYHSAAHRWPRATVLDPTAGGGSIPFEASGLDVDDDCQRPEPRGFPATQSHRRIAAAELWLARCWNITGRYRENS